MDYSTFFRMFGGSARTKNIKSDRHPFALNESGLPKEFIRLDPWEIEYLFTVARRARLGIVETGRFNGGSCFVMACAAPNVPIFSIDIAPQNDDLLRSLFKQHRIGENVDLIIGDSQKTKYPQIGAVDLVFIDGDHSYDGCMNDLVNCYDHLALNGHLLLHDSYCGQWGVQDAIADFMDRHPELRVMQSPFIGASHWQYPTGSIAHLIKR